MPVNTVWNFDLSGPGRLGQRRSVQPTHRTKASGRTRRHLARRAYNARLRAQAARAKTSHGDIR